MTNKIVHVSMPRILYDRVKARAVHEDRSVTQLVRVALRHYLHSVGEQVPRTPHGEDGPAA